MGEDKGPASDRRLRRDHPRGTGRGILIRYLDTSVVVTALTREAESGRILAWLAEQPAATLAVSSWVGAEFASALRAKFRAGLLDTAEVADAEQRYAAMARHAVTRLDVSDAQLRAAADLVAQSPLPLRAPDALHIAVARRHGAKLATRDRGLAAACEAAGWPATLL